MSVIRTASRPKAPPESAFSHYAIVFWPGAKERNSQVVGFHGGEPPVGAEWVCKVGDAHWIATATPSRPDARPTKPVESRSMFDTAEVTV